MFARMATAGVLAFLLAGCSKKVAKVDAPDANPEPVVFGKANPADGDKGKAAKKPNWLNDPRFKTDGPTGGETDHPSGKPGWGAATAPAGGWKADGRPPGEVPALPPGQPATGGPVQPQPAAPAKAEPAAATTPAKGSGKAVTEADMKDVWIFIENRSGATGKMPGPDEVYAALKGAGANAFDLVQDGSIALTGSRTRESVWAYEAKALKSGGFVVTQNGVETVTAAALAQRLAGR